jgi:hypothetical protein
MNRCRHVPALLGLVLAAAPALAADLGKVDRRIAREPAYQARPSYCLVVLGPEASTRVWLVLAGNVLYVDRNGNGDLAEPGKATPAANGRFRVGDIIDPDGKARRTRLTLWRRQDGIRLTVWLAGQQRHFVGFDESDRLRFADRPEDAPIVHVGGPLTFRWFEEPPTLVAGGLAAINVSVGTPGVGKGSFAAIHCCTILDCKTAPRAEFTFPHRDPKGTPIVVQASIPDD